MRRLRDQAVAVETRLKERKRSQLMQQVRDILDRCVTSNQPPGQGPSKYPPSLTSPTKTPCHEAGMGEQPKVNSYSLPSSPPYDDAALAHLHSQFLGLSVKEVHQDVSQSDTSALSTDLGPYMEAADSDTYVSDTTTPRVLSETDADVSSLSASKSSQRIRRLSYTLEAPSPVLLRHLRNSEQKQSDSVVPNVPRLNLFNDDDSLMLVPPQQASIVVSPDGKKSSTPRLPNSRQEPIVLLGTPIKQAPSNSYNNNNNNSRTRPGGIMMNANVEAKDLDALAAGPHRHRILTNGADDLANGNHDESLSGSQRGEEAAARNGNQHGQVANNRNLIEGFLLQQQQAMKELMDQQAAEQERLINLFKEQEEQLMLQIQASQATAVNNSSRSSGSSKSPACRNLNRSFERVARARRLFDSGRLSALVRGYLTRRLLATDRVQGIIQTIGDTTNCLKDLNQGNLTILPSDVELHRRLIAQLHGAIQTFHDIFFHWSVAERMMTIRRDREKKELMITGYSVPLRSRSRSLSSATQKSLERKQSSSRSSNSSSRPSSSSVHPRTSPSSQSSSTYKRSPSSLSSFSAQSTGA